MIQTFFVYDWDSLLYIRHYLPSVLPRRGLKFGTCSRSRKVLCVWTRTLSSGLSLWKSYLFWSWGLLPVPTFWFQVEKKDWFPLHYSFSPISLQSDVFTWPDKSDRFPLSYLQSQHTLVLTRVKVWIYGCMWNV